MGATWFLVLIVVLTLTGCASSHFDSSYWRAPSPNLIVECPGNDIRCKDSMERSGFERLEHLEHLRTRPGSFWLTPERAAAAMGVFVGSLSAVNNRELSANWTGFVRCT